MAQLHIVQDEKKKELRCWADLMEYNKVLRRIDHTEDRIQEYRETMCSPGSPSFDGMPRAKGDVTSRQERAMIRLDKMERELKELVKTEGALYDKLEEAMQQLDPDLEQLLVLRYFDGKGWKMISEALWKYEEDFEEKETSFLKRTFKMHGTALNNLERVYNQIYPLISEQIKGPEKNTGGPTEMRTGGDTDPGTEA